MQGMDNAINGKCKEWKCKEWEMQGTDNARNGECKERISRKISNKRKFRLLKSRTDQNFDSKINNLVDTRHVLTPSFGFLKKY